MEFTIVKTLSVLAYPPASNLVLILLGLAMWKRWRRAGPSLAVIGSVTLLIASSGLFTGIVGPWLEPHVARTPAQYVASGAEAIVVLGGGRYSDAAEYGGDTVSANTLIRLRFGARVHRATGLPVMVSGGRVFGEARAEADLMREVLEEDFRVPVRWVEDQSRNTVENARYSARLLQAAGLRHVIVVSQAVHLRRAAAVFEQQGLVVTPAGTDYNGGLDNLSLRLVAPSTWALDDSTAMLHEWLGELWYRIRY